MTSRILVTGATGFIGRHLCAVLSSEGESVVALTRRKDAMALPGGRTAVIDDLLEREAVREALEDVKCVVHLAARVHAKPEGPNDPGSECHRVNVDGTVALLEEAVAAGVKTFVYISSVEAVAGSSEQKLTAGTFPRPIDPYGLSKLEAERRVTSMAMEHGIAAPILRLPAVYGPGMKGNIAKLFWAVDRGIPLPFAAVRNRRSFAYVGNVVAAIQSLVVSPSAAHQTFYASDVEDLSTPELIERIGKALGKRPRMFRVEPGAFEVMRKLGGLLSRIAPFHLSGDSLSAVLDSLFVDSSGVGELAGFHVPFSVDEGMSLTAEWFRQSGAGR